MRNLKRRLEHLEQLTARAEAYELVMVVSHVGVTLSLDPDRCLDVLRESGYLRTGPHFSVVKLTSLPVDLAAPEVERYLQEHGNEICKGGPPNASSRG